ncbi:HET domain-containing protein [Microdochium nivale]|nr:HET domain-containing protein [Microdochium nivale]
MSSSFHYHPLDDGEFRLISLACGSWTDPISFSLGRYPLNPAKHPYYEAVSYVWGSLSPFAQVTCDGVPMGIGLSAEAALRRFRLSDRCRLIWIDAVCINQEDFSEKARQVALMAQIYQQASKVLIFLGEADRNSDNAMDAIAERRMDTEAAIHSFISQRTWFQRVWILQEVALAQHAVVVCGSKCISWTCVPAWWARNAEAMEGLFDPPSTLTYERLIIKQPEILQQLHDTRRSRATNPHDKVYALLGLLAPEDRASVLVDYTQTIESLYISVALGIINRQASLRLLSAVLGVDSSGESHLLQLPSWVPNWTAESLTTSLGLSNRYLEPYDAGGLPAVGIRFDERTATLTCMGIVLDTITYLGEVCPLDASGDGLADILNSWHRVSLARTSSSYPPRSRAVHHSRGQFFHGDSSLVEFWLTLSASPTSTIELSPEEHSMRAVRPIPKERLKFCLGRRLLITKGGHLGLAPAEAQVGDSVVVLVGAPVPHVVRRRDDSNGSDSRYTLFGECFVHGVMGGEALSHLHDELRPLGHRSRPFHTHVASGIPLREINLC